MNNNIDMSKSEMISLLSQRLWEVKFIKKDGSERIMNCTTNGKLIPAEHEPKGIFKVNEASDVVRVYDIEANGWRSFNYNKVLEFSGAQI